MEVRLLLHDIRIALFIMGKVENWFFDSLYFQQMTFYLGYKNVELLFAGLVINTPGGKILFFFSFFFLIGEILKWPLIN